MSDKVKRYDTVYSDYHNQTIIVEDSRGDYVLYKDYKKLLDGVIPSRKADFSDVVKVVKKQIKILEKSCHEYFEKKDKINYGCAIQDYREAEMLRKALHSMENLFTDDEGKPIQSWILDDDD